MSGDAPLHHALGGAPADGRAFWFRAPGGPRLRGAVWGGAGRGTVLILNGRTECIEKYGEPVRLLRDSGFAVVTLDWRGQGLSDRTLPDRRMGHVGDFAEYRADLDALCATDAVGRLEGPRVILAHSMGGCIGLGALIDGFRADAAIFTDPMWGLPVPAHKKAFVRAWAAAARLVGKLDILAPQSQREPYLLTQDFDGNDLTSDPDGFAFAKRIAVQLPDVALGGPSLQWAAAAFRETGRIGRARQPGLPILTFLGSDERVVSPDAIRTLSARQGNARLVLLDGARHEPLVETPAIRQRVWDEIGAFLDRTVPG